jgi:hypothetical protein
MAFKLVMETDGTIQQSSEEVDKALIYKPYPSYNYFDNLAKGVSGLVQFGGKGGYTKKGGSECIVCYENKPNAYSRWCRECNACLCAVCFRKCISKCPQCRSEKPYTGDRGQIPQRIRNGKCRNVYKDVNVLRYVDNLNYQLKKWEENSIEVKIENVDVNEKNDKIYAGQEWRNMEKQREIINSEVLALIKLLSDKNNEYQLWVARMELWKETNIVKEKKDLCGKILEIIREQATDTEQGWNGDTMNLCANSPYTNMTRLKVDRYGENYGIGDWNNMIIEMYRMIMDLSQGKDVILHKGDNEEYNKDKMEAVSKMSKEEKRALLKALQEELDE